MAGARDQQALRMPSQFYLLFDVSSKEKVS